MSDLAAATTGTDTGPSQVAGAQKRLPGHKTWVWTITALTAVIYSVFPVFLYITYQYSTYDLGIFDQAVRSYAHFQPGISIAKGLHDLGKPNFSVLGDHFSPIDAVLAPLYWIYDSPVDLLIAQAVLFALAVPSIWAFTRRAFGGARKGTVAAYFVSVGYALSWMIVAAVRVGFHEVAFVPVLTAVALERLQKGRLKSALLALFGLLLVKEDMGLYVAGLGLGLAATRALGIPRQRLTGLVIAAVGLVVTFVAIYVVIPAMGGRSDYYWAYQALGNNIPQALGHIISDPAFAAKLLVTPWVKVHTMLLLFAPFLFLSLLSPITWTVFPLLFERMLGNKFDWWQDLYQYNAYFAVPIALGAVDGVLRLQRWTKRARRRTMPEGSQPRRPIDAMLGNLPVAATAVPALVAVAMIPYSSLAWMFNSSFYHRNANSTAEAEMVSHVPSGIVIETTAGMGPHLDNRDTVEVWSEKGRSPLYPPWVIVNDKVHQPDFYSVTQQAQRIAMLRAHGYVSIFSVDGYSLMRAP